MHMPKGGGDVWIFKTVQFVNVAKPIYRKDTTLDFIDI